MKNFVSVIIPAHNEAKYIPALLSSIDACLETDKEIIVVDNASTDNTAEICKGRDVLTVTLSRKSYPAVARNRGADVATGQIFAFLDADVTVTPEWGRTVAEYVNDESARQPFLKGAPCLISSNPSWIEKVWFEPLSTRETEYINGANLLVSSSVHELITGFDEALETNEDIEYCLEAARRGVDVGFDRRLVTRHEGFPKNLAGFIRRERWHGSGDCKTLNRFFTSKIALASVFFALGHLSIVAGLFAGNLSQPLVVAGGTVVLAIVLGSQFKRFGFSLSRKVPGQLLLSYVYFVGRTLAIADCVSRRATLRGSR